MAKLESEKQIVILMTCGPSTPSRCATPFFIASLLASMDAEVLVFLTMEAVQLARKGIAENLVALQGGKTVLQFIREAKMVGVQLHMCQPAMPGYEIQAEDLIGEIDHISSGGVLADMLLGCDKVITF